MVVTEKCDVYSFGVVTLEVLMGTHPGELISAFSNLSEQHILLNNVLDQRILPPTQVDEKGVISLAMVAIACLRADPKARPTMQQISQFFEINNSPSFLKPFNTVELSELMYLGR